MSTHALLTIAVFIGVLLLLSYPLGIFLDQVMNGKSVIVNPFLFAEKIVYKICGIDVQVEMTWLSYAFGLILFNAVCIRTADLSRLVASESARTGKHLGRLIL